MSLEVEWVGRDGASICEEEARESGGPAIRVKTTLTHRCCAERLLGVLERGRDAPRGCGPRRLPEAGHGQGGGAEAEWRAKVISIIGPKPALINVYCH